MMNLKLKKPLQFGQTTISSLTFRDEMTASDYLAFDQKGGVNQRIEMIASLTGTDRAVIEKLKGADYLLAVAETDRLIAADEAEAFPPPPKTDESDEQQAAREKLEKK